MSEAQASAPAFGDWAALYRRFRPGYPAAVFDRLSALTGDARGLCVELGAGSGQATGALCARFDAVIAVEPDAEMARLIAPAPDLSVIVARAEDVDIARGSAAAVVAATAFHWMDQVETSRRAARWLAPGGVFFAFAFGKVQYPEAPRAVVELLQVQLTRARAHMDSRISSWRPYGEAVRASGAFAECETFEVYAEYVWTPEEVAGFIATTSFGQALARSTGDAARYLGRLTDDLAEAARGRAILARIPIEGAYGRVGPTIS